MSTVLDIVPSQDWEVVAAPEGPLPAASPARRLVQAALAAARPSWKLRERRREVRHPFPYPLSITPVGDGSLPIPEETIVAVGKHLAESGLDFYCLRPLPYRRVIVTLDLGPEERGSLLMD